MTSTSTGSTSSPQGSSVQANIKNNMKKIFEKILGGVYELPDLVLGLFFVIGIPVLWWFELQEVAIGFLVLLFFIGMFRK